jgi:hypothetical protein
MRWACASLLAAAAFTALPAAAPAFAAIPAHPAFESSARLGIAGAGLDAEAADDIWLTDYKLEAMIWVDNHGQRPAGNIAGHATILGQHFSVWNGGTTWTFLLDHNQAAGQTHILGALRWLTSHRDIPADVTLAQVGFGWEIASTGGRPLDFTVTRYRLMS